MHKEEQQQQEDDDFFSDSQFMSSSSPSWGRAGTRPSSFLFFMGDEKKFMMGGLIRSASTYR